jgi:hypothetical protein
MFLDISLDFFWMLSIVHEGRVEILGGEVRESPEQGPFRMMKPDGFNDCTYGNSGASNARFASADLLITNEMVSKGTHVAFLPGPSPQGCHFSRDE